MSATRCSMPQHEGNALLGLPTELISQVLGLLDARTLLSCQLTSRSLNDLIRHDFSLKYSISLFACGMRANGCSRNDLQERLERLSAYDEAWRNLRPTASMTLYLAPGQRVKWPQAFMVSYSGTKPSRYMVIQLPPSLRSVPERRWSFTVDLTILHVDVSQDLLLCIDRIGQMHLLTLSNASSHPLATDPIPPIVDPRQAVETFLVGHHIFGEHLCVVEPYRDIDTITILNWRSGDGVNNMTSKGVGFTFLSTEYLLVPSNWMGREVHLAVYRIKTGKDQPVCEFALPTMVRRVLVDIEGGLAHPRCDPNMQPLGDFCVDPDDGILVCVRFTVGYTQYSLFVRSSTLLSYTTNQTNDKVVSWDEWGPKHTRLTVIPPESGRINHAHCLFGLRHLWRLPKQRSDGTWFLELYDYHPRRVARAARFEADDPHGTRPWSIIRETYVDGPWEKKTLTVTRLPCILTEMTLPDDFVDFMLEHSDDDWFTLGEDSIIAQINDKNTGGARVHVWTF